MALTPFPARLYEAWNPCPTIRSSPTPKTPVHSATWVLAVRGFKTGTAKSIRQPFCSQLEERLLLWLEYNPQVVSYARGDIGPSFATTYRLPIPKQAPFAIGYTFEGKPHDYLPDVVGQLQDGTTFIAEAGGK